jgi:threonine dehydrogenase-like Zn-dependent dehydrogenase
MTASLSSPAQTMWAMALAGPGTFARVTTPRPQTHDLGKGRALLRVLVGGICGSDGPYFRGAPGPLPSTPLPGLYGPTGFPMHEIVGEVLATDDPELKAGQRVVGWAESFDGLAELVTTRADGLAPYNADLTPAQAVLIQPLACVLYAVERIGDVRGHSCAVIGLGPIGMLFAHVLASRGAATVLGVDPVDRSSCADDFKLDSVVSVKSATWVSTLSDGERPHVVVEAVGHQVGTLNDALQAVGHSGSVFYFGVPDSEIYPINMERMVRKNLTLQAGGTLERRRVLLDAGTYLGENPGLADALVTHVFDVADVQAAYDCALKPQAGRLKVAVRMGRDR